MNLTGLNQINCIERKDCFDWCQQQHFSNDFHSLWIVIWSSVCLLIAIFIPLLKDWLEDFISEETIFLIQKSMLNSAIVLNIAFLVFVALQ